MGVPWAGTGGGQCPPTPCACAPRCPCVIYPCTRASLHTYTRAPRYPLHPLCPCTPSCPQSLWAQRQPPPCPTLSPHPDPSVPGVGLPSAAAAARADSSPCGRRWPQPSQLGIVSGAVFSQGCAPPAFSGSVLEPQQWSQLGHGCDIAVGSSLSSPRCVWAHRGALSPCLGRGHPTRVPGMGAASPQSRLSPPSTQGATDKVRLYPRSARVSGGERDKLCLSHPWCGWPSSACSWNHHDVLMTTGLVFASPCPTLMLFWGPCCSEDVQCLAAWPCLPRSSRLDMPTARAGSSSWTACPLLVYRLLPVLHAV